MEDFYNIKSQVVIPEFKDMFDDFCTFDIKTKSRIQHHPQNAIMNLFTIIIDEELKYPFDPFSLNREQYILILQTVTFLWVMYTEAIDKPMSETEFKRIDRILRLMYYLEEDILNEHKMEPLSIQDSEKLHLDKLSRLDAGKIIFKQKLIDEFKTFSSSD